MKLPFLKSRRKKKEQAPEAEITHVLDIAAESLDVPAPKPAGDRPRKVPTERVIDSIGYALAAVPSIGPTVKAWRKLGFVVSPAYSWLGCQAAHIDLEGGGVRFLAVDTCATSTALVELVRARLIEGAGLIGWTWACAEPHRSAVAIAQLAGSEFHEGCAVRDEALVQIPMELTPAAATWLEKPALTPPPRHANSIVRLDHIVLNVSQSKAVSQTYERHFGLKSKTASMNDRYYAFVKTGPSLVEIVGPMKPPPGALAGGAWVLAFGSSDIDATATFLQNAGVAVKPPHRAVQGGRITGMPMALGGIQIAFMGE